MLGLRTQEDPDFINFFELVQKQAGTAGKVFFLDCGEGHDFHDAGSHIDGEDLSGWLIDKKDAELFQDKWQSGTVPSAWDNRYAYAEWSRQNDRLRIEFKQAA